MRTRKRFQVFIACVAALFLGLIAGAVFLIDSPEKMKLRKQDETRAHDLGAMARQMSNWYDRKDRLPDAIQEIRQRNVTSDRVISEDPITGEQYKYRLINEHSFELCATFVTSNIDYGSYPSVYLADQYYHFSHDVGETCYQFNLKKKVD